MEKSPPDRQILVFLTPTSGMNDEGNSQGRLPIGNGQAPGIEIGRGAAWVGTDVEVEASAELTTAVFAGGVPAAVLDSTVFFAAVVFAGFLAALRAAGLLPAALFFGARFAGFLVARTALFFPALFFADFFGVERSAALRSAARFRAPGLRAPDFLATRFADARTTRFAAFLDADLVFVAIRSPPIVKRGIVYELQVRLTAVPPELGLPNHDITLPNPERCHHPNEPHRSLDRH